MRERPIKTNEEGGREQGVPPTMTQATRHKAQDTMHQAQCTQCTQCAQCTHALEFINNFRVRPAQVRKWHFLGVFFCSSPERFSSSLGLSMVRFRVYANGPAHAHFDSLRMRSRSMQYSLAAWGCNPSSNQFPLFSRCTIIYPSLAAVSAVCCLLSAVDAMRATLTPGTHPA